MSSSSREVVDRVGGRFPLPDDGFNRLNRRRDRKRRNQRIGAGALALLIVLVGAGAFARVVMTEGVPADAPAPTAVTPTDEPRRYYEKGDYYVTIDEAGCTIGGREGPVRTERLIFNLTSSTGQYPITFDIGMIDPEATYQDLVAFVDDQRASDVVGIHRSSFFKAPLKGYYLQGNTGHFFGEGLITLTRSESTAMWYRAREGGVHSVVPGTYAVVCYRGPVEVGEPVGVVGPVVVR